MQEGAIVFVQSLVLGGKKELGATLVAPQINSRALL